MKEKRIRECPCCGFDEYTAVPQCEVDAVLACPWCNPLDGRPCASVEGIALDQEIEFHGEGSSRTVDASS